MQSRLVSQESAAAYTENMEINLSNLERHSRKTSGKQSSPLYVFGHVATCTMNSSLGDKTYVALQDHLISHCETVKRYGINIFFIVYTATSTSLFERLGFDIVFDGLPSHSIFVTALFFLQPTGHDHQWAFHLQVFLLFWLLGS